VESVTSVLLYLLLPLVAILLLFGWLVYLAHGKRAFKINLEGFGMKISVDAARAAMDSAPAELTNT